MQLHVWNRSNVNRLLTPTTLWPRQPSFLVLVVRFEIAPHAGVVVGSLASFDIVDKEYVACPRFVIAQDAPPAAPVLQESLIYYAVLTSVEPPDVVVLWLDAVDFVLGFAAQHSALSLWLGLFLSLWLSLLLWL